MPEMCVSVWFQYRLLTGRDRHAHSPPLGSRCHLFLDLIAPLFLDLITLLSCVLDHALTPLL
jgi:hypothetical protein